MYHHETAIKALQEHDRYNMELLHGPARTLALTYCGICRTYHTANGAPGELYACDIPF